MKKPGRVSALVTASAITLSGLAALPPVAAAAPVPHGGILRVVMPWGKIPHNFNPLLPGQESSTAPGTGSLLYEPLMYVNAYTGRYTPMLATAYAWSDGNRTLTLTTRSGAKWADGAKFSATDVAFTFNYLKTHKNVDTNGIWGDGLLSVQAPAPNTVVLRFAGPTPVLLPIILSQLIVPEHIWHKVATAVTFRNLDPVGTGPFVLRSYSPDEVIYVRNPFYWMAGRPYVDQVNMTSAPLGTKTASLLNLGYAYTSDAVPDPATFVATNPLELHYWWPVTSTNFLYFNTREAPFNNVAFRRAIAEALNDPVIAQRAYFGAIPAATGGAETGIVPSQLYEWVPASLKPFEWTYSPARATATLRAAGFRDVGGSLVNNRGKAVPTLRILIGFGWEDYISMAETITQELAPLGIHTLIDQEPFATYEAAETAGTFDMAISWGIANSVSPFYEYLFLLDGDKTTDWEHYSSPSDTGALLAFATHTSPSLQKQAMASIERDILTNVPVVALTGRPNFFEYSTKTFTGWPNAANPYNAGEAPDDFTGGAEQLFLNIHLK